jgi:hypothetical protein
MSNYHVEPADRPQALTSQALKARRREQVQGISRRQLLRTSLGAGIALWLLEVTAGTIGFIWPNLAEGTFGGDVPIGSLDDIKVANASLPFEDGFPVYVADARAFVMLVNPARQEFVPGTDDEGDGAALNVRALYQRCPHLLDRVPVPWIALRPARREDRRRGLRPGPARDGPLRDHGGRGPITDGSHGADHAGPASGRARPAGCHPAEEPNGLHLIVPTMSFSRRGPR